MSSPDLVDALAKLLHDRKLREFFSSNPEACAQVLDLDHCAASQLFKLDRDQLNRQAEGLVSKRRSNVARLIPVTWKQLGKTARDHFSSYVDSNPWPKGHRRHHLDAVNFCEYLKRKQIDGYQFSEHAWLEFCLSQQRLRIFIARNGHASHRNRRSLEIFVRWLNRERRHYRLPLPF